MSTQKRYCVVCLTEAPHTRNGCRQCHRRAMTGVPAPLRPPPNACESCGRHGPVCLDHDHTTGAFRGWICKTCNGLAGMHSDSPQLLRARIQHLRKIVAYLERRPRPVRPPVTGNVLAIEPGMWAFERRELTQCDAHGAPGAAIGTLPATLLPPHSFQYVK